MMKCLIVALLLPALVLTTTAEEVSWLLPGHLLERDGDAQRIWLVSATKTSIRYCPSQNSAEITEYRLSERTTVCLDEPPELAAATSLYQARKYAEARLKFIEVKERFKPLVDLKNNPSTLAAFYETECLRKTGDLEGLAAARGEFSKDSLTRGNQLRQLELDEIWESVRLKNWQQVEALVGKWEKSRLPGDQRAQLAYCQGLVFETLNRPEDALLTYNIALTADAGASEEIARLSALRVLAIYHADGQVREALRLRGSSDEDKTSTGAAKLAEAVAVARLFQLSFGGDAALPAEFAEFLSEVPNR